jgi:hypothetical protein
MLYYTVIAFVFMIVVVITITIIDDAVANAVRIATRTDAKMIMFFLITITNAVSIGHFDGPIIASKY